MAVCVAVRVAVAVAVLVGVGVGLRLREGVTLVAEGDGVVLGPAVTLPVPVLDAVDVQVPVRVAVDVWFPVLVAVEFAVAVPDGVTVEVSVASDVGVTVIELVADSLADREAVVLKDRVLVGVKEMVGEKLLDEDNEDVGVVDRESETVAVRVGVTATVALDELLTVLVGVTAPVEVAVALGGIVPEAVAFVVGVSVREALGVAEDEKEGRTISLLRYAYVPQPEQRLAGALQEHCPPGMPARPGDDMLPVASQVGAYQRMQGEVPGHSTRQLKPAGRRCLGHMSARSATTPTGRMSLRGRGAHTSRPSCVEHRNGASAVPRSSCVA